MYSIFPIGDSFRVIPVNSKSCCGGKNVYRVFSNGSEHKIVPTVTYDNPKTKSRDQSQIKHRVVYGKGGVVKELSNDVCGIKKRSFGKTNTHRIENSPTTTGVRKQLECGTYLIHKQSGSTYSMSLVEV